MNGSDLDQTFLTRITYFAVIVVFGLVVWLIFSNLILPAKVVTSDYTNLVRTTVDPELATEAVRLMASRQSYSEQELDNFSIYLRDDDSDAAREYGQDVFLVQRLVPQTPYDLGYIMMMSASSSAQIDEVEADL